MLFALRRFTVLLLCVLALKAGMNYLSSITILFYLALTREQNKGRQAYYTSSFILSHTHGFAQIYKKPYTHAVKNKVLSKLLTHFAFETSHTLSEALVWAWDNL